MAKMVPNDLQDVDEWDDILQDLITVFATLRRIERAIVKKSSAANEDLAESSDAFSREIEHGFH